MRTGEIPFSSRVLAYMGSVPHAATSARWTAGRSSMLIARIGRLLGLRISKYGMSARASTFRMKTRSSICASCGVRLVSRRAIFPRRVTMMGSRGRRAGRPPSRDTILAIGNTALRSRYQDEGSSHTERGHRGRALANAGYLSMVPVKRQHLQGSGFGDFSDILRQPRGCGGVTSCSVRFPLCPVTG
jgi:hypothetical protein